MRDLIDRQALLAEYDRIHIGEPGKARKMIEDAPSARIEADDVPEEKQHPLGDLISRQEAIDLVDKYFKMIELNGEICIDGLISLPTARSESLTNDDFEFIRIHLNAQKERLCNQSRWKEAEEYQHVIDRLIGFASAQPEPLTDKEQRIFLAAMEREEDVCKEVDEKYPYKEPYEDSLIRICREIRRKVKDALWT